MKNIFYSLLALFLMLEVAFADGPGITGNFRDNDAAASEKALREGDVSLGDIPNMIQYAINFFMGIAGTIAIIFIIIGAYQILFGSISQDKTKGRNTIIMALTGFALASLSWFIISIIITNLSQTVA